MFGFGMVVHYIVSLIEEKVFFKKQGGGMMDIKNSAAEAGDAMTDDEKIDAAAARILKEYRRAFEELAR